MIRSSSNFKFRSGVQDEHPWLKTVHEEDVERGEGAGGQDVVYETDEEEFMLPGRSRPGSTQTASVVEAVPKRKRSRTLKQRGYQLAYFTLWWSRMLREGVKEEDFIVGFCFFVCFMSVPCLL